MKITTNNKPRQMVSFFDLPLKAQSDFDYIEGDDKYPNRFVSYKGNFYDVYDTQRIEIDTGTNGRFMGHCVTCSPDSILAKWDSVISESAWSGMLFKLTEDDGVVCGSYTS